MKLATTLVFLSLTFLAAQSCFAQVCPLRKDSAFLTALQSIDKNTKTLSALSHSRKRTWSSGYKLVTPQERIQFAIDYQDFLVSQGETGVITDFHVVPVIPYEARLSFGLSWWKTSDKTYSGRPPVDATWVHDALVDAGNTIQLACQTVKPMDAERANRNKVELNGVDNRNTNGPFQQKND